MGQEGEERRQKGLVTHQGAVDEDHAPESLTDFAHQGPAICQSPRQPSDKPFRSALTDAQKIAMQIDFVSERSDDKSSGDLFPNSTEP